MKDLREILRSNLEATSGKKADLVLKIYAILARHVSPARAHATRPSENQQQSSDNTAKDHQNTTENSGDFKYDETKTNLCSRMVHLFTSASRTKFYSALRLRGCVNAQVQIIRN